jgi:hypothetical protein
MAASGVGYLICKRGGYISMPFGFAFISAPILALYQKRELDFYEGTANAMYLYCHSASTPNNWPKSSPPCSSSIIRFWARLKMKFLDKSKS